MTDGPRRSTRSKRPAAPSPDPPAAPSPDRPKKRARNQSQEQAPAPPPQAAPSAASSSAAGPSSEAASPAAASPAAAAPTTTATQDQGSGAETPEEILHQLNGAELLEFIDNEINIDALALHDTSSNNRAAAFIVYLSRPGAQLTEPMREGLIRLLRRIADEPSTPAAVRLIQCGVDPPRVGSNFPHLVEVDGAPLPANQSAEGEACVWQQYKSKMTHITVQLRNEHGSVMGNAVKTGGVELELTLHNADDMELLSNNQNPRKGQGLLAISQKSKEGTQRRRRRWRRRTRRRRTTRTTRRRRGQTSRRRRRSQPLKFFFPCR